MRKELFIGLAILAAALPASAQQPQALLVTATNVTAQEASREGAQGALLPGDVVEYRLLFTNITPNPVENVVFNDPIPAGLVLVLGTAGADRGDVAVDYSIDGGQSWSVAPEVEVTEAGQPVRRPAPAPAYTHIRWTVTDAVAVGAQVTASFRAQARGAGAQGR